MGVCGESTSVVIRIRIQRLEPLTGAAATGDGAELVFEGWMELIGVVAELLGPPDLPRIGDQKAPDKSPEKGAEP